MSEAGGGRRSVVVGLDGSPSSLAALRWARRQADLCRAPLEVVVAWPVSGRGGARVDDRDAAEALATAALADAQRTEPLDVTVSVWVPAEAEAAPTTLVRRGAQAGLIVVGPHGRHSIAERVLGTVTEHVLAHARCPVAIVRSTGEHGPRNRVVVGIDGTPHGGAALLWAADLASVTHAEVWAVLAWEWRPEYAVPPYGPSADEQRARAEQALAHALSVVSDEKRVHVHAEAVRGDPVPALLEAAAGADLLVIGARRSGGAASRIPGSVTRGAIQHAEVPIVVVPDGMHSRS